MNQNLFNSYVLTASNSIDKLRKIDVYRVIESAYQHDKHKSVSNQLKKHRPDLIQEIDQCLLEFK